MPRNSSNTAELSNRYTIKGEYDGDYEVDDEMYIMDFDKGSIEKKEIYYNQKRYKGHIWINGKEITPKVAAKLRPLLACKEQDFCWGDIGDGAKIVSLAICQYILRYTEWAQNVYQVFAEKYIYPLKRENFEIEIDLTDFLIDNREKLTHDYFTHYYKFSGSSREIVLVKNSRTNLFSVNLLDEVTWAYVEREEFSYNWKIPSFNNFFGMKEKEPAIEKPPFNRKAAFKTIRRNLQRQFFKKQYSRLEDTSFIMLDTKIQYTLSLFSYYRDEYMRERSGRKQSILKKNHRKFLAFLTKEQREEIKNFLKK